MLPGPASHAVVDHWRDDSYVERFRGDFRAINDVMEELLAAASLATRLIPSLARWVGREGTT